MVKVFDKINASNCSNEFRVCEYCKMKQVCYKIADYNPCFYRLNSK